MKFSWRAFFLIVCFATSIPAVHVAASGKLSPVVVNRLKTSQSLDLLVFLESKADLSPAYRITDRVARIRFVYEALIQTASISQAPILKLAEKHGASATPYFIDNVVAVQNASRGLIEDLNITRGVAFIGLDASAKLALPESPTFPTLDWSMDWPMDGMDYSELNPFLAESYPSNITGIGVDRVWNELNVKGKGIVIAGQDSGYEWTHPALRSQYRGTNGTQVSHDYNWHDAIRSPRVAFATSADRCGFSSAAPCDGTGHGTHTMGTMIGDGGRDNRIGVAPEAKWIGCKNMSGGVGYTSTYLECFEFFLAPYPVGGNPKTQGRPDLAPHIVNNSWSCPPKEGCTGGELIGAVRAMRAAGILVVAAAGNDGPSCSSLNEPPGSYIGELVSVGAYNRWDDDVAYFSNRGPSTFNGLLGPDLVAPGNLIRSSVPSWLGDGPYDSMAGTSMASPHVAGAVALLWSAKPHLIGQIDETMSLLKQTAKPRQSKTNCGAFPGRSIPNAAWGHGLLNVFDLIQTAN